ncbi:hypothetical protein BDZ94DRAFT_1310161 [Collybia nuda]|uniref:Uncharacterized protein n=1 Tax=Collybia nuda TaxID=64659 RepID=A0A9P5Y5E9_9AGAR|nr:hypothetical protein BDZ94DRAFT_1310161 [Collybia nuda]
MSPSTTQQQVTIPILTTHKWTNRWWIPSSPSPQTPKITTEPQITGLATQEPHNTRPPQLNTQDTTPTNPVNHTTPMSTHKPSKQGLSTIDALVAINRVVTNTNGLQRTAIPGNGFPVKCGFNYTTHTTLKMCQANTLITENCPTPTSGPPHHFLISSLSQQAHDCLVNTGVIATETTIILALPFTQPLLEYIGTLKNSSLGESGDNKQIVAKAIKLALMTNPGIMAFVNNHLPQMIKLQGCVIGTKLNPNGDPLYPHLQNLGGVGQHIVWQVLILQFHYIICIMYSSN